MKIVDRIQGVTPKADAEAMINSEKNKEIAEKTFKGRMVKPMKSKEEVNTKLELDEAWFQDLDPDEEIIDMFTFINSLFTRGESGYHMPKNPLGRRYHHFEYRDRDGDANEVSPVGSNSDGDVVLLAETKEEFDDAKEICDKYDFTYQIKPYRGKYFKHQMIINVPEDLDGNPMDVKTYFDDLGIDLEDVMPVTAKMKSSIKKQIKAKNESFKACKNKKLVEADEDLQDHVSLQAEFDLPDLLNEVGMYAHKFNDSQLNELNTIFGRFMDTVGQILTATKDNDKKQIKAKEKAVKESYADRKSAKNIFQLTQADLDEDPGFLYYINPTSESLPILMDNVITKVTDKGVEIEGSLYGGMIGGLHKMFIPYKAFHDGYYVMAVAD